MAQDIVTARQSLRSPRAAAIAGIAFALMLGTALVLVRLAVPTGSQHAGSWLDDRWRKNAVVVALYLVPFAGLAFLWFVGVIRDRIGLAEDRLFATVFLGTGLLFVAMLFVTAAVAGGLIVAEAPRKGEGLPRGLAVRTPHDESGAHRLRDADGGRVHPRHDDDRPAPRHCPAVVGRVWCRGRGRAAPHRRIRPVGRASFPLWVLVLSLFFLFHPQSDRGLDAAEPPGRGPLPPAM